MKYDGFDKIRYSTPDGVARISIDKALEQQREALDLYQKGQMLEAFEILENQWQLYVPVLKNKEVNNKYKLAVPRLQSQDSLIRNTIIAEAMDVYHQHGVNYVPDNFKDIFGKAQSELEENLGRICTLEGKDCDIAKSMRGLKNYISSKKDYFFNVVDFLNTEGEEIKTVDLHTMMQMYEQNRV